MAPRGGNISVAKMLQQQRNAARPKKAPQPEKEERKKARGMAMTVEDMAEELAIGRSVAYQLIQQEDFPSFTIGKRVLVNRKGLQEWIDRQCRGKPGRLDLSGEEEE